MRIAVYSGSFDPLHIGHLSIMEHLTADAGFDIVYLVISPQSPFKDAARAGNAAARFQAAAEAVARHPGLRVRVDDIELSMPSPNYTIDTLDALKRREPENDFTLVFGADHLDRIHEWKDYRRILKDYGVVVFPREGFDTEALRKSLLSEEGSDGYRITLIDAPLIKISSTRIREGYSKGEDMSAWTM